MPTISVSIPVADFWPSSDELAARDSVIAALNALSIGSCTGCGGGRGVVDFSYRVADATHATEIAQRVILAHIPTAQPRIHVTE